MLILDIEQEQQGLASCNLVLQGIFELFEWHQRPPSQHVLRLPPLPLPMPFRL